MAAGFVPREVKFEYSPSFPEILKHCQASLLVSTCQAGKFAKFGVLCTKPKRQPLATLNALIRRMEIRQQALLEELSTTH